MLTENMIRERHGLLSEEVRKLGKKGRFSPLWSSWESQGLHSETASLLGSKALTSPEFRGRTPSQETGRAVQPLGGFAAVPLPLCPFDCAQNHTLFCSSSQSQTDHGCQDRYL